LALRGLPDVPINSPKALRLDIRSLGGHKKAWRTPDLVPLRQGESLKALVNLVRLSRPSHWLKNGFVLAALVFARKVTDAGAVVRAAGAFAAFCLASSAIYALNDVVDRREDAQHPSKRTRPVASGAIGGGWPSA